MMLLRDCVKCMHTLAESAGSNRRKRKWEREKCAKKNIGQGERRKEYIYWNLEVEKISHNLVACIRVTEK